MDYYICWEQSVYNATTADEAAQRVAAILHASRTVPLLVYRRGKNGNALRSADRRIEIPTRPSLSHTGAPLNDRETAILLHGLRMIQCQGRIEGCAAGDCDHFAEVDEMANEEIDELCERLNCEGVSIPAQAAPPIPTAVPLAVQFLATYGDSIRHAAKFPDRDGSNPFQPDCEMLRDLASLEAALANHQETTAAKMPISDPILADESNRETIVAALLCFKERFEDCEARDIYEAFPHLFPPVNGQQAPPLGSEDVDHLIDQLAAAYPCNPTASSQEPADAWAEHAKYTRADWQAEVNAGDTQRGYRDWVSAQIEQAQIEQAQDAAEESETRFTNYYVHCRQTWEVDGDSMHNDRCPVCNAEIEPYASQDQHGETTLHAGPDFDPGLGDDLLTADGDNPGWPEGMSEPADLPGWSTCQHAPGEDCMNCAECGKCSESLDENDVCSDCIARAKPQPQP